MINMQFYISYFNNMIFFFKINNLYTNNLIMQLNPVFEIPNVLKQIQRVFLDLKKVLIVLDISVQNKYSLDLENFEP